MDLLLAGETAVVTGGSKGTGLAVVRTLLAERVRAVAVSPSPIRTGLWTDPDGFVGRLGREQGMEHEEFVGLLMDRLGPSTGRMSTPEEVAGLIAFVTSPDNANGVEYLVDGPGRRSVRCEVPDAEGAVLAARGRRPAVGGQGEGVGGAGVGGQGAQAGSGGEIPDAQGAVVGDGDGEAGVGGEVALAGRGGFCGEETDGASRPEVPQLDGGVVLLAAGEGPTVVGAQGEGGDPGGVGGELGQTGTGREVPDPDQAVGACGGLAVGYAILQGILLLVGITADALAGSLAHEREWGSVGALAVCTALSAVVGLRGALLLRRDRGQAFGLLRTSVLIGLLAGQTFDFTVNQFSAVTAWLFGLVTLWVVAAEAERLRSESRSLCH